MISTWLAASYTNGSGSAAGRIALVAVAVLAVGAYAFLQLKARSRRVRAGRLRYDPWDWRTYADQFRPESQDAGETYGNEEPSRLAVRRSARVRAVPAVRSGPVTVDRQGPGGQRPAVLSRGQGPGARRGGRPPSQAGPGLPKVFVSGKRVLRQRWVVLAADTGGAARC